MAGRFNPDDYIGVHERIETFYNKFPQGRIITTVLEHDREAGFVMIRAEVYREPDDAQPSATGHAYELKSAGHVQAGSYVEVCETSSVGRALALLGFEVQRGASREDTRKVDRRPVSTATSNTAPAPSQIVTSPDGPQDVHAKSSLNSDIEMARTALGWSAEKLNTKVWNKFQSAPKDWSEHTEDERVVILSDLNRIINKRNAE